MTRRVVIVGLVLALLPSLAVAQTDSAAIAPSPVSMTALQLDIDVDYDERTLSGTGEYTLRNETDAPIDAVPMQVHRLMRFTGARGADGRPLQLEQDLVQYSDTRRQVTQARVTLERPLAPGDSVVVIMEWNGLLWGYTETGSLYIRDRVDEAFTIIRDDAAAFPTPRVPSWQAGRASPRADFRFRARVTVPDTQVVAAGGVLVERTAGNGRASYIFESTAPVPFLNIVIAPYGVTEREGVRIYHFREDSAGARMMMDALAAATDTLASWFGPLGRPMNLTVMEIPQGFGSQASLSAGIIMDASAFRDREQLRQLYHEVTHLWNAPDSDRPSPRWNEGLASYLEMRLTESVDGWTGFDAYMPRYLTWFLGRFESDTANLTTPFIDYGRTGRTDNAYGVGFLMFYALDELVGRDRFNELIGGWYQSRRDTGGSTEEFIAHVKRHAGIDLDRFFEDWMYTTRWHQWLDSGRSLEELVAHHRGAAGR